MIRLHHANIRTAILEESVQFYRDVLGLNPGPALTRPGSNDFAWMSDSDGVPCLHLQRLSAEAATNEERTGLHHLAFSCTDVAAWRDKLTSLAIEYTETDFPSANMVQINIRDPNGVRLELAFNGSVSGASS